MKDTFIGILMLGSMLGLVCTGGLAVAGGGDGAWSRTSRVVIERPASDVFAYLAEPGKRLLWIEGLTDSRNAEPGRVRLQSRLEEVLHLRGEPVSVQVEVTAWEPEELLVTSSRLGTLTLTERFELSGSLHRTRLVYTLEGQGEGLIWKLFEPILSARISARRNRSLKHLEQLLEGTLPARRDP